MHFIKKYDIIYTQKSKGVLYYVKYIHYQFGNYDAEYENVFQVADNITNAVIEMTVEEDFENWCNENFDEVLDYNFCEYLQNCWYNWEEIDEQKYQKLREKLNNREIV